MRIEQGAVADKRYVPHRITERLAEHKRIATLVAKVRAPLVSGSAFKPGAVVNPFSGAPLRRPIDTVVGRTEVPLYRSNFGGERMPAVIEGASHDFLTDAFRQQADARLGIITGFRYGTVVAPGPITLEDLYHFMPVGAQIARGQLSGKQIRNALEGKPQNTSAREGEWVNGWTARISRLVAEFDPLAPQGARVRNLRIGAEPVQMDAQYSVAGFWYQQIPTLIKRLPATDVVVVKDKDGAALDATDVVARYLESLPGKTVPRDGLQLDRIRLVNPLPAPVHGVREMQPLGAVAR